MKAWRPLITKWREIAQVMPAFSLGLVAERPQDFRHGKSIGLCCIHSKTSR